MPNMQMNIKEMEPSTIPIAVLFFDPEVSVTYIVQTVCSYNDNIWFIYAYHIGFNQLCF